LAQQTHTIYFGQAYNFNTLAGMPPGSANGTGPAAMFSYPSGVAADASGNLYVADYLNCTIRKIAPVGIVTTLAGTAGIIGSADGTGPAAQFAYPSNLAVDSAGNVYVSDSGNNTIREITPYGVVTTLAGTPGVYGSMNATGPAASFMSVNGIGVDASGNVYVADLVNDTIRMITSEGVVTTFAGATGDPTQLNEPYGVAVDGSGNVYVTDIGDYTVKMISPAGVISPLAGLSGTGGSQNGTGTGATFSSPLGIALDSSGNLYVADNGNFLIREIMPGGVVSTFAGNVGVSGDTNGSSQATFGSPYGVAVDSSGNVYVGDASNNLIRAITPAGDVSTLAGMVSYGSSDGKGDMASFGYVGEMAVDGTGNVYVWDSGVSAIRKITPAGVVTTLSGISIPAFTVDNAGDLYYIGTGGVDMMTPAGVVTQIGGNQNLFVDPVGMALDGGGNVYLANGLGNNILKITPAGATTVLADSSSGLGWMISVAVDSTGNVYAADWLNQVIRKITPTGTVSILAGQLGVSGEIDGPAAAATFILPTAVAVDSADNVYVVCYYNARIRKISAAGLVTTIGGVDGQGNAGNFSNGTGAAARFFSPNGVAVDGSGNVYVSDSGNFAIRKGTPVMSGDLNGDDKADILWQNTSTTERGVWLMDGTAFSSYVSFGDIAAEWQIAGSGDFTGSGQTDVLWQNTSTGECGVWLMDGPRYSSWVSFGIIPTQWRIAGTGDFTGTGQIDIVWQNTSTGDCGIWLMHGTAFIGWADLGIISTAWRIVGTGDFNGDGQTDILWQNTSTGECGVWLMNGTSFSSYVSFGDQPLQWQIAVH